MPFLKLTSSSSSRPKSTSGANDDDDAEDLLLTFADCGAVIDPSAVFREITAGTSFEKDKKMQGHLNEFAKAFLQVAKTSEGNRALSLETRKRSPPGGMTVLGHS
jgi:hypothetical protein